MLLVDKGSGEKVAMSSAKSPSTTVKMIYSQSRITVSKQNGTAARRIREKYNNKRSVISLPFGVFHVVFSLFLFFRVHVMAIEETFDAVEEARIM